MIRKAVKEDIPAVTQIYNDIHTLQEAGLCPTGWKRGIYPTSRTAEDALKAGTLFVLEQDGKIAASAKIDRIQVPAYADCQWTYKAPEEKVMVLHTLVVDPGETHRGLAASFVRFYEDYAGNHGCPCLRIDTNVINLPARALYRKLGYTEAGIVPCCFNGIEGVKLVCLEKRLY